MPVRYVSKPPQDVLEYDHDKLSAENVAEVAEIGFNFVMRDSCSVIAYDDPLDPGHFVLIHLDFDQV